MRFSVLIPVYNVELYLGQCLDSVMNQTFTDYEVVIIDDGSTDSSGNICDKYAEIYNNKINVTHQKNQGLIAARRQGISQARGEFCVFVDSDDFIESNLLERVNETIVRHKDVDMILYTFRYFRNGKKGEYFKSISQDERMWDESNKKDLYTIFLNTYLLDALWTKAIRTDILKADRINYEQYYSMNMSEDTLQSIWPLTLSKNIVYINVALYNYRINTNSVSRSFRVKTIPKKNTNHVYYEIKNILPLWELNNRNTKEALKQRWFNEAIYTFSQYYQNATSLKTKKEIVDYDWNLMIPEKPKCCENTKYENLYSWIEHKQYISIYLYFYKKKVYSNLKRFKGMLKNGFKK